YHADQFYLVSTTDKEAVLEIAKKENVNGVLAYASDPAAPTAAYVAEQLGLPTNPSESVDILCNKDRFRDFLRENHFNSPRSDGYTDIEAAIKETAQFRLPVIVKPVDSSGSKGATVLYSWDGLREAVDFALTFSRSKRFIIEEFIEKGYPYIIGGDVFVSDGEVKIWGLMNCHRDNMVNPLVPVGKSYPPSLDAGIMDEVKNVICNIISKLGFMNGAVNVELIVDKNGSVWPIDFGPRCGGNMIPNLLGYIFHVDVVELSVLAAMGKSLEIHPSEPDACYATHNLHVARNGSFVRVDYSEDALKYKIDANVYVKEGDLVAYFDNASKAIGIIFFRFDSSDEMNRFLESINEQIKIILK
ncbi:MAG: ATP-grasp domain-containing protein, partial [Ruminococcus sp.]|nr:ATP-grasp domain-containing protein [Ruminococcus sp.]